MFTYVNTAFYILDEMLIIENEMCRFFLSCLEWCKIACTLSTVTDGASAFGVPQGGRKGGGTTRSLHGDFFNRNDRWQAEEGKGPTLEAQKAQ